MIREVTAPSTYHEPTYPELRLEPEDAFPELADLRFAMRGGDWRTVSGFFDQLPDDHARAIALTIAGDVPETEQFVTDVVTREPGSALARALYGQRYVGLAWEVRTSQRAKNVSKQQFATMREHLITAERVLIDLTAWRPDYALGWAVRLTTSMGLELGMNEAKRRYAQLAKVRPHLYNAQARMLQLLCPKWCGTWEEMFGFVRECVRTAPDGSLNPALIADAHLERGYEMKAPERTQYLRQPAVIRELQDAARRSVLHPAFRRVYGWVGAHSCFAAAFSLAGEYRMAAVHFRELGDLGSRYPWSYYGDAQRVLAQHRAAALGVVPA